MTDNEKLLATYSEMERITGHPIGEFMAYVLDDATVKRLAVRVGVDLSEDRDLIVHSFYKEHAYIFHKFTKENDCGFCVQIYKRKLIDHLSDELKLKMGCLIATITLLSHPLGDKWTTGYQHCGNN